MCIRDRCVGIAFVILIMAPSYPVMLVAAVIFGIGFGTFNPAVTMAVAGSAASPKYAALAISVYTCGTGTVSYTHLPQAEHAFEHMLRFAENAARFAKVYMTIIDTMSPEGQAACLRIAEECGAALKVRHYLR